jgi:hypothetical protein
MPYKWTVRFGGFAYRCTTVTDYRNRDRKAKVAKKPLADAMLNNVMPTLLQGAARHSLAY